MEDVFTLGEKNAWNPVIRYQVQGVSWSCMRLAPCLFDPETVTP
ncbi:hypothetical protein E1H18_586 [Caulobacter sp. RHG1]|nr:hypothetical protein [Caulobacter sp. RHG1]